MQKLETLDFLRRNYLKTILISSQKSNLMQSVKDLSAINCKLENHFVLTTEKRTFDRLMSEFECLGIYYLDFKLSDLDDLFTSKSDQTGLREKNGLPADLQKFYPLDELKALQERLVSAVWFGGTGRRKREC